MSGRIQPPKKNKLFTTQFKINVDVLKCRVIMVELK